MRMPVFFLTLLAPVLCTVSRAAETLIVPYNQTWDFLNPMGVNVVNSDSDFDATWWLPGEEFTIDYNGPAFSTALPGAVGPPPSINSGSGPGPLGFGSVDNWIGLLEPFEGGSVDGMGTELNTPSNVNRKATYYRTNFYTDQTFLRPIIRCVFDDGGIIFIDGVQVARVNVSLPTPASLPTYTTTAMGDGSQLPVQQHTERTRLTIDLSIAGNQGVEGGLQVNVINPVTSLIAGTHTMAVFICNVSQSNGDELMALQLTADDAGITPVASNVVRNVAGTPGDLSDDTFEFDVTVTQTGGGTHGWTSNIPARPAGSYGQVYHFSGFPITGPASITFKDADLPSLTTLLKVNVPPPPLTIGQIALTSQPVPLYCSADTSSVWVQTGADAVQQTNAGGAPHVLKSTVVTIPPGGALFEAFLEFDESSSNGNFEENDTLEAHLLLNNGSTTTEVNLISPSLDVNGDGVLNGYTGSDYNEHIAKDEFNLAGQPAEAAWTEGMALSYTIPAGTMTAQLVIRAVNDHPTEVFRVKAVRFGRMQGEFDRDSDGVSDADELSAGTDPFDAGSFLKVTHYKNGNSISVTFPTIRDRSYRVLTSDDLVHWTQENPNPIVGDGGVQGYSVNNGGVARRFICVQVKRGLNAFP